MKSATRFLFPTRTLLNKPAWFPPLVTLIVIVMMIFGVVVQMVPPKAIPASAPTSSFSAGRAFEHLQIIARAPHPTGSPENAIVLQYLFDQLAKLGLQPEIQTSNSVYHDTGKWGVAGARGMEVSPDTWGIAGATVHNVMARIPGTDSTGAIVLAAHYDSVPFGPGAGDDGSGVAAILEAARAILTGPPLRNDVILLLLDGEEIGLLGSQAFAESHPWMRDAALVLNLEARGSSGVALMYETSMNNAWLIQEYAKAAQSPVTSSLATDVWRMMPNSSDLTVFLQDGKQGMNFAFSENWTDYHTTHDSLDDLDLRSLQHHGDNTLALVKHYGQLNLTTRSSEEAIFFSVMRLGVIHYPKSWAIPFLVAILALFVIVIVSGIRKKVLSLGGLGIGILALLAAKIVAALTAFLTVSGLGFLKDGELQVGMGGTYQVELYELGLLAITFAVTAVVYTFFKKWARPAELAGGALFFWLVLTAGSTFILPGGSYLFSWPLLAGLLVLALFLFSRNPFPAPLQSLLAIVPVIAGLVLFGTAVYLVQRMFGVTILPAGAAMTVLLLALAFPYIDFSSLPRPGLWVAGTALAGLFLIAWIGSRPGYDLSQPRQNFLFYSMNADSGQAAWVAGNPLLDETLIPWMTEYPVSGKMGDVFPGSSEEVVWINPAQTLDQPAPVIEVLEDYTQDGVRFMRLKLLSQRGAWAVMANVEAEGAILAGGIYGKEYSRETPRDHLFFKVIGLSPEGVEITITLLPGTPLMIELADVTLSLPAFENGPSPEPSPLRTGFGGGHGIDWMTVIQKQYLLE